MPVGGYKQSEGHLKGELFHTQIKIKRYQICKQVSSFILSFL